jgi:hypothetical protein
MVRLGCRDLRAAVAVAGAGVAEALAGDGEEVPVVAVGLQCQLQHAVGRAPPLAVGLERRLEAVRAGASGPEGELADPEDGVGLLLGVLGGETLVDVLVPVEDQVGAVLVQGVPQRL